jgi:hypothetical protein
MGTDLFGKYYNNPTKSSIYSQLSCNGRSADELSFDINGNEGVITDNANTLATIDLSDVHVTMTQYTSDMKTINPFTYIYIKGMSYGDTLSSKFYGKIPEEYTNVIDWEYNCSVIFSLKYRDNLGNIKYPVVIVGGNVIREETFIDEINLFFESNNITISASYNDGFIRFDSTQQGFDFWINHVMFLPITQTEDIYTKLEDREYPWIVYVTEETYVKKYILFDYPSEVCDIFKNLNDIYTTEQRFYIFEDIKQYIAPQKYRNGAMKGIILKATYPSFNSDDIYDYQESLKIAHITDRLEDYIPVKDETINGNDIYHRRLIDVIDSYNPLYDNFHITCSCDCTGCEPNNEDIMLNIISKDNVIGLEGYVKYLHEKNLWNTVGQFYARTGVEDVPDEPYCKNYIPSVIIYNPNPFPVIINYLTFA